MDSNGWLRRCVRIVRLSPFVMGFASMIHCGLLVFGIKVSLTEYVCCTFFTACVILLPMSIAFKFCRLHRLFILYTLATNLCIGFEMMIGFGMTRPYMRLAMFIIGIVLHALLSTRITHT